MEIGITKVSSRGQVVIPQDIRKDLGIKEQQKLLVYEMGDAIVLKPIGLQRKSAKDFEATFKPMWETARKRGITREDVAKEIEAYRREKPRH